MKNWRANLNTVLNSLNNKHIGELEISLMRITIPNLHIYKINFYPETVKYWEINPGALVPFWATPEATILNLFSVSDHRFTKSLICAISAVIGVKNASQTLWINQRMLQFSIKRDLCLWGSYRPRLLRRNPSNFTKWKNEYYLFIYLFIHSFILYSFIHLFILY